MVVGTLRFVLRIPGSASLKAKRAVMRKVIERIRARFNVAAAEVGDNDLWQKATIGVAAVGNDRAFVNEVLDKVLRSVEEGGSESFVVSHELEILTFSDMYGGGRSASERTLAEAEGLMPPDASGVDDDDEDGAYPTLDELEEAAASYQNAPPPRGRRR